MTKTGNNHILRNCHVTMTKKDAYISKETQLQNHSLVFRQKKITSFSNQHSTLITQGLKHYSFLERANLYQLCRLWQMSRQIWTILLVQKRFQLLGRETQNIQERLQQRGPTCPKCYNGRSRFQPTYAIGESAGQ